MTKKTILITGANKGIGFEIARQLGISGHHVVLAARNELRLQQAVQQLMDLQVDVSGLLMDVSDVASIGQAADEFGRLNLKLDVLVNNAAILDKHDHSILRDDEVILKQTLTTNCYGVLRVVKAFLPFMKNPSRIINLSSGGGSMTDPVGGWSPAYCVSKTLLNALTRQLSAELLLKNISVNAVCPGWVRTDMGGAGAALPVEKGAETPVWLATEAPQYLTGLFFRNKKQIPW
ncbi:MAG: SDR family NAD(P)-dependent oxidoreductase [Bacteroidales bacterium]|nr:SDR family NAD(P)-dependent oxidoreductase [Bacteroidales bacterium]